MAAAVWNPAPHTSLRSAHDIDFTTIACDHSPSNGGCLIMYGLIGNVVAVSGKRNELAQVLVTGVADMPGCLSYIVAMDPGDPNVIWITEVWESEQAHVASLSLASVKKAITKGRPLISVMGESTVTTPIGGYGL